MVKDSMLSKEEKAWIKVRSFTSWGVFWQYPILTYVQDHNRRCLERLEPYIREDKRALKWLRREGERGIGQAGPVAGGLHVDWN